MIQKVIPVFFCLILGCYLQVPAQPKPDSTIQIGQKYIQLSEVVVSNQLNIPVFIERIKNDTSFYKAFRNLRVLNYSAINDVRMLNKSGESVATLFSKTRQLRENNCRRMEVIEQQVTGDYFDEEGEPAYYTAEMYAGLFFTKGLICGESNIVAGKSFTTEGKSGMEKHKEQLKMLFFNPGKRISGLPFMSSKTAIYDEELADLYDMKVDMDAYNGASCYIFSQKVKPGKEGEVVVDSMTTWLNDKTFEMVARTYSLSYSAGVYDFDVTMEVQLTHAAGLLVPSLIRYTGNWKALFKRRENGVFTATLYDFK
ncbi:MAG: hypothetical protein RLY16_1948 [Bacteroidota bacterium]